MNRKLLEDSFSSSWVDALGESFFSSTGFAYIGNYIGKLRQTTTVYPVKDKEDLEKSTRGLYFIYNYGASNFCSLSSPEFHKESIYRAIEIRVKEIDKILNI